MTAAEPRIVALELAPTKTYSRRRAVWIPGDTGDGRLGTLSITQDRAAGGSVNDRYGVQLDSDPVPPGFVAFILRNDDPPQERGREEFYRVVVGEESAGCSCTAAATGSPVCKHRCALVALLRKGGPL